MAVSKVTYNGTTLIDLTSDTVAADKLLSGYTAHNKAGQKITGTLTAGTVPVNGSLIVCACSTDITAVEAVYNGITQGAYLDTTNHIAYVTIPYTYTGTVTLNGYCGSIIRTSGTVTISGVDKYLCPLSTSSILYNAGTWTGYGEHEWYSYYNFVSVTEYSTYIQPVRQETGIDYLWLKPAVNLRGYSNIEITITSKTSAETVKAFVALATQASEGSGAVDIPSNGTYTIEVPSAMQGQVLFIGFQIQCTMESGGAFRITKIEFV